MLSHLSNRADGEIKWMGSVGSVQDRFRDNAAGFFVREQLSGIFWPKIFVHGFFMYRFFAGEIILPDNFYG